MISMSEEKSLLFDVIMTRMRVNGNEFVGTSEFESDVQSAVDVIAEEVQTLRAKVERLTLRLNWIRENQNDGIALRFALEANDEEIDVIKTESE